MDRRRWYYAFAIIAVVAVIIIGYFCFYDSTTTIVLVRHAERADTTDNSNLSQAGLTRAQALVSVVDEASVNAIYSTDFCRTAQTAQPTALATGLPINVHAIGGSVAGLANCTPAISVTTNTLPVSVADHEDLVDHILSQHRNQAVLIVAHSDTGADIVEALGQGAFAPVTIGSNEFDRLFVVTVRRFFYSPRLVKGRYGG